MIKKLKHISTISKFYFLIILYYFLSILFFYSCFFSVLVATSGNVWFLFLLATAGISYFALLKLKSDGELFLDLKEYLNKNKLDKIK